MHIYSRFRIHLHLLALQNPFSSCCASSRLISFNSMTLPFQRLSCSVPSFSLHALPANGHSALFTSILYSLRWRLDCYPCGIALVIACNNYLDAHLLSPQNCFSSYNASSCLINFNSVILPFPRLQLFGLSFLCRPCLQMIILHWLRRSFIRCVDDLTITLQYHPCNSIV